MNRVCTGDSRCRDNCRDIQIAVFRGRRTDADAFVGKPDMHRVCIRGGVNSDSGNTHFLQAR